MRDRVELRLRQVLGLSETEARHVVDEIYDLFRPTLEEFIESRHRELQREGYRTDLIYGQISTDLADWRFSAPSLSLRQIRRRLYG